MRKLLRLAAFCNAIYQGAVGVIAVLSPMLVAELFHIGIPSPVEAGVIRLLGSLLCGNALVLLIIARQGDGIRELARWALMSGVINLLGYVLVAVGGDLPWSALMVSTVLQALLVLVLIAWLRTPGAGIAKGSSYGLSAGFSSSVGSSSAGSSSGPSSAGSSGTGTSAKP